MRYAIDRVVHDVRVAMDRDRRSGGGLLSIDTNALLLDEAIMSSIVDGVRLVLLAAPLSFLDEGLSFADKDYSIDDMGKCCVRLPSDFLRLLTFAMDDWSVACVAAGDATSPLYPRQHSAIKALRGVSSRPLCFVVEDGDGKVLECYSSDSMSATIRVARYIALPRIEEDGIDIPLLCYGACVCQVAALVLLARGATELAGTLQQEVQSLLTVAQ